MKKSFEAKTKEVLTKMEVDRLNTEQFLFSFRGWWFVEGESYEKIAGEKSETVLIEQKLEQYPDMPVTIFIAKKSSYELPEFLKDRKGVEIIEDTNEQNISEYILTKTGVKIPVTELGGIEV